MLADCWLGISNLDCLHWQPLSVTNPLNLNPYFDLKIFSFVLFPCGFLSFFLSALVPLWLTLFRILPQDQPQADHGFDFMDCAVLAICFWKRLR